MKIEEFMQVYTPVEMERIENRKKEEGNTLRNNLLGNLGRNVINERTRGKNEISPEKAVRLFREAIGTQKFTQCFGITRSPNKRNNLPSKSPKREKVRVVVCEDRID